MFEKKRRKRLLAPYVHAAATRLELSIRSFINNLSSKDELFKVFAHERLFIPTEIAKDFKSALEESDKEKLEPIIERMNKYAERY